MEAHAPHRLEPVATIDEVIYINDSKATFLDATLETLAQMDRHTVWIVGAWSDDMAEGHVQDLRKDRVAAVVLFGPTSSHEIELYGRGSKIVPEGLDCLCCYLPRCDRVPHCQALIAPQTVLAAVQRWLPSGG